MHRKLITLASLFITMLCYGQQYNKEKACGIDTITIDLIDRKTGERIQYKALECTQVGKAGIRFDIGRSSYSYDQKTKKWLGNHGAALIGLSFVHGKLNIGAKFKLASTSPASKLAFNGDTLPLNAKLNPPKIDLYAGYSFDLEHNISIEPYIGLTRNLFYVINEDELNKNFNIRPSHGLLTGLTLNKYFRLKEFQFISVFLKYAYGFTNFRKTHPALGRGQSEWALGLSYKVFAKKRFHYKIQ